MVLYVESADDNKTIYVGMSTLSSIIGSMVVDNNKLSLSHRFTYPYNMINDLFESGNLLAYVASLLNKYIILFLEEYPNPNINTEDIELRGKTLVIPVGYETNLQDIALTVNKQINEFNNNGLEDILEKVTNSYRITVDGSKNKFEIRNMKSRRKFKTHFNSIIEFRKVDTYITNVYISSIEVYDVINFRNRLNKLFDSKNSEWKDVDLPISYIIDDFNCFYEILTNNENVNCNLEYSSMISLNTIYRIYDKKPNSVVIVSYYQYKLQEYMSYYVAFLSKKSVDHYKDIIVDYIKTDSILRISDINDVEFSFIRINNKGNRKSNLKTFYI